MPSLSSATVLSKLGTPISSGLAMSRNLAGGNPAQVTAAVDAAASHSSQSLS